MLCINESQIMKLVECNFNVKLYSHASCESIRYQDIGYLMGWYQINSQSDPATNLRVWNTALPLGKDLRDIVWRRLNNSELYAVRALYQCYFRYPITRSLTNLIRVSIVVDLYPEFCLEVYGYCCLLQELITVLKITVPRSKCENCLFF
jgi:hypothetical protein